MQEIRSEKHVEEHEILQMARKKQVDRSTILQIARGEHVDKSKNITQKDAKSTFRQLHITACNAIQIYNIEIEWTCKKLTEARSQQKQKASRQQKPKTNGSRKTSRSQKPAEAKPSKNEKQEKTKHDKIQNYMPHP